MTLTRICILGGGFGGLSVLLNLTKYFKRYDKIEITLVDRKDHFLFTPLLHEAATGEILPESITFQFKNFKSFFRYFNFIQEEVLEISTKYKKVFLSNQQISYDYLILAFGSEVNFYGKEKIKQYALPLKNIEDSQRIKNRVIESLSLASKEKDLRKKEFFTTFVIAGAGATGTEIAGSLDFFIKDKLTEINNITPDQIKIILADYKDKPLSEFQDDVFSNLALRHLERMGINLLLHTKVKDYDGEIVSLFDSNDNMVHQIKSNTLIWAAGVKPSSIVETLDLPKKDGKILVDDYLNIINNKYIFALGDCVTMEKNSFFTTAQTALQQAETVANNIASKTKLFVFTQKFKYIHQGSLVTIGRDYGISDLFGIKITGLYGWLIWKLIHLIKINGFNGKINLFMNWLYQLYLKKLLIRIDRK
jgi:NADH dehydrogenase